MSVYLCVLDYGSIIMDLVVVQESVVSIGACEHEYCPSVWDCVLVYSRVHWGM